MNGILLIDKPEGWTSHDIAAKLKGMLRERRIGHSGTLDPMATGLLVMFVGRATRAVEFAEAQSKRYIAGLRLGVSTDTQDTTGNILRSCEASVTREALADAIKPFIGDIMQIPPMYSAIKVNGQKLCDIARRGGEVERKPRPVTIHGIEILGGEKADWTLDVECSKGTYIRTLCNDIGESLNVGGCMSSLRRIRAGERPLIKEGYRACADCGKAQGNNRIDLQKQQQNDHSSRKQRQKAKFKLPLERIDIHHQIAFLIAAGGLADTKDRKQHKADDKGWKRGPEHGTDVVI